MVAGCASSEETAERDTLTLHVGKYDPPPPGIHVARVGISPFTVTQHGQTVNDPGMAGLAADQMYALAVQSERFEVIERAALGQLVREWGLEGIVDPNEMAKSGKVSGVDYLIYGKITNFRIKAESTDTGFNLAGIPLPFGGLSAFDYNNTASKITAECGVDIRMVDPTRGSVAAAHFGEFKKTDAISAFGISILGFRSQADADLRIDEDNQGKILRLALDDAFRKMLPTVDKELLKVAKKKESAAAAGAPAAKCSSCGKALEADAKFCASCGTKVPEAPAKAFCAGCGKELEPNAKFCPNCGTKAGG
jgi:curli biogenesis system outer membrane secretion channel CsgG